MKEISAAYRILGDPARRAAYDAERKRARVSPRTAASARGAVRSRRLWSEPAACSQQPTILGDSAPPPGFASGSSRRRRLLSWSGQLVANWRDKLPAPVFRIAWIAAVLALCAAACPFVPFLVAAQRTRGRKLELWAASYAAAPLFLVVGEALQAIAFTIGGGLLLVVGCGHVWLWRRVLYRAATGRDWDPGR
jgi:hypothetical protein